MRGDIQNLDAVRNLAVIPAGRDDRRRTGAQVENYLGGTSSLAGVVNPWTTTQRGRADRRRSDRNRRLRAASSVRADQRQARPLPADSEVVRPRSEVDASNNVLRALPQIVKQFPEIDFKVINVQSKFTQQQIDIVTRTLMEGDLPNGIAMVFFLRSWRNAIVVCVSIPTSLAIAMSVMKLLNLTLDTISLLGMSLVIGILVDDSTVVLENIERHFTELREPPEEAAVARSRRDRRGRDRNHAWSTSSSFFRSRSFKGQVGRQIAEFAIVVVISTLTSLFVSFTVTPTLAGLWALRSHWKPGRSSNGSPSGSMVRDLVRAARAAVGPGARRARGGLLCRHVRRWRSRWLRLASSAKSSSRPSTAVKSSFSSSIRSARRCQTVAKGVFGSRKQGAFGAGRFCQHGSRRSVFGLVRRIRLAEQRRASSRLAQRRAQVRNCLLGATVPRHRQKDAAARRSGGRRTGDRSTAGGNTQPIDFLVTDVTGGDPTPYAQQVTALLSKVPGATSVNSTGTQLGPEISVEFDRDKAQALGVDLGQAAAGDRRSVRRRRGHAVRNDRRTRASSGHLSRSHTRRVSTGSRTSPMRSLDRIDRPPRRHCATSFRHRRRRSSRARIATT